MRVDSSVAGHRRPPLWPEPHEPVRYEGEAPKRLSLFSLPLGADPTARAPTSSYTLLGTVKVCCKTIGQLIGGEVSVQG